MAAGDTGFAGEVTRLLDAARQGQDDALDRLVPLVYDELRAIAERRLRREHGVRTMNPTDLVHEAYLKLSRGTIDATSRPHFLAVAARAMRQVLVEQARRRHAEKRGGDWARTTLDDGQRAMELDTDELLALDAAIETLDERQRRVVELRFFGGLEEQEIAAVLGVTDRTVRRDWVKARAWLYEALYPEQDR